MTLYKVVIFVGPVILVMLLIGFLALTAPTPEPPLKRMCRRSQNAYVYCLSNPPLDCRQQRAALREFCGL